MIKNWIIKFFYLKYFEPISALRKALRIKMKGIVNGQELLGSSMYELDVIQGQF